MSLPTTGVLFSGSTPQPTPGDQLCEPQTDGGTPAQIVSFMPRQATTALRGTVKPDGTSIGIMPDATLYVIAPGTGGGGTTTSGGAYVCVTPSGATDGSNTQYTIPATVLAGTAYIYVRNGVTQPQLGANARYAVQGTQLTTSTPLQSDDWHEFYFVPGSGNSESGGGGSVTPVAPGTIRGTSTGAAPTGSNSFAVAWPTGTQIGDLVVIQATSDWNLSVPSGWTNNNLSNSTTWNGMVISKVMTSGDISTGSVTITSAGNQDYSFIAVAFIGSTGGIRETDVSNGTGGFSIATSSAVQATDVGLYFGSGRGAGTAITIARGTQIASVTGTNSQAQLNAESIAAGGTVSVGYVYGGGGGGCYSAVVIVKGS